ncbi:AAA family ATPase [Streptomyces sp. MBT53]|uniref:caspase, EACC1-associated type n=1 Tax=Streptomyces sp. MBT53 TaxID=1488384 RepID=UPI00191468FA|nr:AAA family ATPase [Streptomyces sp. MBT53]MBK6009746.1 AAA family ATPase [Streptomyces sp. MBT53]
MSLADRYGPEDVPDQVLIVSTGRHTAGSGLPDVPAATASGRALAKALGAGECGAQRHVRLLTDPADVNELGEAIADAAERATGLLLVYFIGHGVLGPGGDLYLATCATDSTKAVRLAHTALPCAMLANYLLSSRATARAVVLDCCFSAHSFNRLGGTRTYVMASASEDVLAPSGTVVTPFTAAVIDVLSATASGARPQVTLDDLYREVVGRLPHQAGRPRRLGADAVGDTVLAVRPQRGVPGTRIADGAHPYPGLAVFETVQAPFFHGRERELTELTVLLADRVRHPGPLAVTAPSGTGKSSLLRAGMLAAVRTDHVPVPGMSDWPVALFQPGRRPIASLARALAAALPTTDDSRFHDLITAGGPALADEVRRALRQHHQLGAERRLLMVVDQFEQVFTAEPTEREAFLTALQILWRPNGSQPPPAVLVYAAKLDFYGSCMAAEQLTDETAAAPFLLGPLHDRQIERMITGPALRAGLELDGGLPALVHQDLAELSGGRPVVDPQNLPLMAHALRSAYEHGDGLRMTVADYLAVGGASKALARTASTVFATLDPAAQKALRALLPLLVCVGDDAPDTARQATEAELLERAAEREAARRALDAFTAAGLMREVAGPVPTYELAHETLLRHWPEMQEAVAESHESQAADRRIRMDAEAWEAAGRDSALLYRGGRLDLAVERTGIRDATVAPITAAFVDESVREQLAERRHTALQRGQRLALVALIVAVSVLTPLFAMLRSTNKELGVARQSQNLTEAANRLRVRQQAASMQVSLAAWKQSPNLAGRSALLNTLGTSPEVPLSKHDGAVYATAVNKQDLVATSGQGRDRSVRLTDLSDPFQPRPVGTPLKDPTAKVNDLAFSPDDHTLWAADAGGIVWRWDITRPESPRRLPSIPSPRRDGEDPDMAHAMAFDRHGTRLAVGYESGRVLVYDTRTLKQVAQLLSEPRSWASAISWSHDDKLLATASAHKVQFWAVGEGGKFVKDGPAHGGPLSDIGSLAFSDDDKQLFGTTYDGFLATKVWSLEERRTVSSSASVLLGPDGAQADVVNVPTRKLIAVGGVDRSIVLLTSDTLRPVLTLAGPAPVASIAPTHDGSALVAGYYDGSLRVWPLSGPRVLGSGRPAQTVATAPNGRVAALSDNEPRTTLWDLTDPREPTFLAPLPLPRLPSSVVQSLAFSSNGRILAGALGAGYVVLWDVSDARAPKLLGQPLRVTDDGVFALSVALSPDGRLMAAGTADHMVHVWNVENPSDPVALGAPLEASAQVEDLAFGPHSDTLATAALDGQVTLWRTSRGKRPTRLTHPLASSAAGANTLAYSPDGTTLAVGCGEGIVRLWDTTDPEKPRALPSLKAAVGSVYSVAFRPGGPERQSAPVLAAGYGDGSISFWDLQRRPAADDRLIAVVSAGTSQVKGVAFTSDGKELFSVDSSGTGVAWFVEPKQAAAYVCAVSGPPLSKQEWGADVPLAAYARPCGKGG